MSWTDVPLNPNQEYWDVGGLKVVLYWEMIELLSRGQMRHALEQCRALATQYQEELVVRAELRNFEARPSGNRPIHSARLTKRLTRPAHVLTIKS